MKGQAPSSLACLQAPSTQAKLVIWESTLFFSSLKSDFWKFEYFLAEKSNYHADTRSITLTRFTLLQGGPHVATCGPKFKWNNLRFS